MDLVPGVLKDLQAYSDPETKLSSQRYFKEKVNFYGVKSSGVKAVMEGYRQQAKKLGKTEAFKQCEELLKTDIFEPQIVGCQWSDLFHEQLEPEDIRTFERWIGNYVTNWAVCDTLCNHTIGTYIVKFPEAIKVLISWTGSPNRWFKRAAAVTLILPARKGLFLSNIFEIADNLLTDKDDMVQKGYGWMLKAASQAHQQEVFAYVMKHKTVMPRTALRYAIEKMPQELKKQAMAK